MTTANSQNHIVFGAKGSQLKTATSWLLFDRFAHEKIWEVESANQYRFSQLLAANASPRKTTRVEMPSADALRADPAAARDVYAPVLESLETGSNLVDLGATYERLFFEAADAFDHPAICDNGKNLHFVLSALAHERLSHDYCSKLLKQVRVMYPAAGLTAVVWETASEGGRVTDADKAAFSLADTLVIAPPCISKAAPAVYFSGVVSPSQILADQVNLDGVVEVLSRTSGKSVSKMVARAELALLTKWIAGVVQQFDEAFGDVKAAA
ncbi:MAG: hypothetical protein ING19_02850 [Azospirillum sp.]|nr:hypothetical protein [Azospirillum sp.]